MVLRFMKLELVIFRSISSTFLGLWVLISLKFVIAKKQGVPKYSWTNQAKASANYNVCKIPWEYAWHRSPPLIRASHCLHKLTLKVSVMHTYEKLSFSYQSLKMVEVIGFARHKIKFEILFSWLKWPLC